MAATWKGEEFCRITAYRVMRIYLHTAFVIKGNIKMNCILLSLLENLSEFNWQKNRLVDQ